MTSSTGPSPAQPLWEAGDPRAASAHAARLPLWKKILFVAVLDLAVLGALEIGVRIAAYFVYHRSAYFLFYGLRSSLADATPEGHSVGLDGYSKFPASRVLHQYGMFSEPTPIRINTAGLRGQDFDSVKPAGVFRIVALGESSTFGFYARDDHTYPALLERLFADSAPQGPRVEVINAGVPHAKSDNILAMFRNEIAHYSPDVITLYNGYNDAVYVRDATAGQRIARWLHAHFASYVALKRVISALGGPELYSRWRTHVAGATSAYVRRQIDLHVEEYAKNLGATIQIAESLGVKVVLIRQPINVVPRATADSLGRTYASLLAVARAQLEKGERVTAEDATLLVHGALTSVLDSIAADRRIPVVDNIAILDRHPEYFASYVHLTEDGNLALARGLFETILPLVLRERQGTR